MQGTMVLVGKGLQDFLREIRTRTNGWCFYSVLSIAHLKLSGRFLVLALVVCLTTVEDSSSGAFCDYWPQVCVVFPLSLSLSLLQLLSHLLSRFHRGRCECVGSFKELMRPIPAGPCCPSALLFVLCSPSPR